jgi:hypothetical protein
LEDPGPEGRAAAYQKTQAALLTSRRVLNEALNGTAKGEPAVNLVALGMPPGGEIGWLQKNLRTDYDLAPGLLRG